MTTMLSEEEKAGLERLSSEDLVKLQALIREALALYGTKGCMPQSAIDDLVKAVPTKLVREVVNDLRSGRSEPGWLPASPPKGPEEKRGPPKALPLEGRRDIRWIDQMVDVQDAIDKRELEKRLRGG
jgi:hypothetical protein